MGVEEGSLNRLTLCASWARELRRCVGMERELVGEEGEARSSGAEVRDDGERERQMPRDGVGE